MLPPSPLTDPDVQISRIRFFTGELRFSGIAVNDPGPWQRMAGEERGEASPSACMQVSRFVLARRSSHLRHVFVTCWRYCCSRAASSP